MRYTGPTAAVLQLVKARDDGRCLRCGRRQGEQCHHRLPRGMGGTHDPKINQPPNLVWICQPCHAEIESYRADAYRTGWLVRRGADPAEQYLIDDQQHMLMLLPNGGMVVDLFPADDDDPPF